MRARRRGESLTGGSDWRRLLRFRCTGCGNCCRGTYVPVSDEDVRRIMRATRRRIEEFVRFVPERQIEMDKRHPWWMRLRKRRVLMALRWRGRRCVFLGEGNRCTIYEHRPLTCRAHPIDVTLGETGGVERLNKSRLVSCPNTWDGHQTRRELGLLERLRQRDSDRFIGLVRRWNREWEGQRTRRALLGYLGLS